MTVRKELLKRCAPGTLELARKQGYRRGLSTVRTMLLQAKNYQSARAKSTKDSDPDIQAEFEHGASLLHELSNKVGELLKAARD